MASHAVVPVLYDWHYSTSVSVVLLSLLSSTFYYFIVFLLFNSNLRGTVVRSMKKRSRNHDDNYEDHDLVFVLFLFFFRAVRCVEKKLVSSTVALN